MLLSFSQSDTLGEVRAGDYDCGVPPYLSGDPFLRPVERRAFLDDLESCEVVADFIKAEDVILHLPL